MEFKRLNKNSVVRIYSTIDFLNNEETLFIIEENNTILQMIEHEATDSLIVEYLPREQNVMTNDVSFERDIEFENNLDTIINTDPFGAKYSGKSIREIFECGDREWLDKALKLMHNEFIRKKLQYIVDRGGYGKIKC